MEDIRRMEDENSERTRNSKASFCGNSLISFSKTVSVLNKFRCKIRESVIESHFLLSVSLLNSGFLDTDILLF